MTSLQIDKAYPVSRVASAPDLALDLNFSDLVITDRFGAVVWRAGCSPVLLRMTDRLELVGSSGAVVWSAGSNGARCSLGNDGVLRVSDAAGNTVFTTATVPSTPPPRGGVVFLDRGYGANERVYSPNGAFFMVLQGDGNLVIYDTHGRPMWASGTIIDSLVFGADGRLAVRDQRGHVLWSPPARGDSCVFGDDGLRIYSGSDVVWSASLAAPQNYTPAPVLPVAVVVAKDNNGALRAGIVILILLIFIVILLLVISDDPSLRQQQKRS